MWGGAYLFIDLPEEVDLVGQTLKLGLQLNLVHVGLIHVLPHTVRENVRCTVFFSTNTIGTSKVKEITVYVFPPTDLLDEHKVVLTFCALVDFILVPGKTE